MAMHVIVKVDWISLGCYIHDVTLVWVEWHEPVLFPFYSSFEIFLELEAIALWFDLSGHILESVQHAKYLGVTISTDLKWNTHIQQTATKVNKSLCFIRRNLKVQSQTIKERVYQTLIRILLHCLGSSHKRKHQLTRKGTETGSQVYMQQTS
jgi:hypothetical protein